MDLFSKNVDPRCMYCSLGRPMWRSQIGCVYQGVVKEHHHCKRFRYDPLRRIPAKPPKLSVNYTDKDFEI